MSNDEIELKNGYNLNLTRYIDSSEPEDIQDIYAHLHGGLPARDIDGLSGYWQTFPSLKNDLFEMIDEEYYRLKVSYDQIRQKIYQNANLPRMARRWKKLFRNGK